MGKWEMVRLGDVCYGMSSNIAQKDIGNNEGPYPIYGASGFIKCVDFYKHDEEYIAVVKDGAGVGRTTLHPDNSSVIGTMQAILPRPSVTSKYLYYAISGMNLARYYTGATIPHIYFKDYKKELLPLPPLEVQRKIADVLDRASALIEKRKAQIEKLDLLVKSQFVEMFGDPVTNPMGWETSLLKDVCTFSNGKAHEQHIDENGSFKLVTSKFIASGGELYRKTSDQLFPLYKGDICMVMSDVPNGRALAKCFLVDADNTYSLNQRICVFKTQSFDLVFLYHLLNRHPYFLSFNDGDSQTNLRKEEILNCQLILPSLILQNEFTRFVQQVETQKFILQKSLAKMEQNYKSLMQKCFRGEIF